MLNKDTCITQTKTICRFVKLPAYNHLQELRNSLCPTVRTFPPAAAFGEQTGVFINLREGLEMVLQGGLQHWQPSTWLPVCSSTCSTACPNLVAQVLGHADGRGDESQYTLRADHHLDSSHVFGVSFTVPSVHLTSLPPHSSTGCILSNFEEILFNSPQMFLLHHPIAVCVVRSLTVPVE